MSRITILYGSQTLPVDLCMQNIVHTKPELLVSMGPRPHLWICACKTDTLGIELQVSMGSRPQLCFSNAKQRI